LFEVFDPIIIRLREIVINDEVPSVRVSAFLSLISSRDIAAQQIQQLPMMIQEILDPNVLDNCTQWEQAELLNSLSRLLEILNKTFPVSDDLCLLLVDVAKSRLSHSCSSVIIAAVNLIMNKRINHYHHQSSFQSSSRIIASLVSAYIRTTTAVVADGGLSDAKTHRSINLSGVITVSLIILRCIRQIHLAASQVDSSSLSYINTFKILINNLQTFFPNTTMTARSRSRSSWVDPEKLRFDFAFNRPIELEELRRIEQFCNETIMKMAHVSCKEVPLDDAMSIGGFRAVFGETYPDPVRVVSVGINVYELLNGKKDNGGHEVAVEFRILKDLV
jgi:hypothetical protein